MDNGLKQKNVKVDTVVLSEMVRDLVGTLEDTEAEGFASKGSFPHVRCPKCGFPVFCDPIILNGKEH